MTGRPAVRAVSGTPLSVNIKPGFVSLDYIPEVGLTEIWFDQDFSCGKSGQAKVEANGTLICEFVSRTILQCLFMEGATSISKVSVTVIC
jgi:hypothetical protein